MHTFNLHELAQFDDNKPGIQLIARAGHARQILCAFRAGQGLREHTTSSQLAVQIISGQLQFDAAGESQMLMPGQLVLLEGDGPHSVYAESDTVMLLTPTPDPQHHSLG